MFEKLDGTSRKPRPLQEEAMAKISEHLTKSPGVPIALNLPTGVGKSFILRSLQMEFPGAVGIVPSNSLMNQYIKTYPTLNYLKGQDHYECSEIPGLSCSQAKEIGSKCQDCLSTQSKVRAFQGESTIFNPISYYYFIQQEQPIPKMLVVDEAHKLLSVLELLVNFSFRKTKYPMPVEFQSEIELLAWLDKTMAKIFHLASHTSDITQKKILIDQYQRIKFITASFRDHPEDFVYFMEKRPYKNKLETYLVIRPVSAPRYLINRILKCEQLILLSATLMQSDLWQMGLTEFEFRDFDSPIPKEARKVLYRPGTENFRFDTPPVTIANYLKHTISQFEASNVLIHVSYGWSKKLAEFFPDAKINTPETKDEVLEDFKKNGGIWLASGCSEGIDLPDNECRLIIIPIIFKNNPSDPVFKKLITRKNGYLIEQMNVLKTVIQQSGRGTRSETDYCTTVIGDAAFPRLVNQIRGYLPKFFLESIQWSKIQKS